VKTHLWLVPFLVFSVSCSSSTESSPGSDIEPTCTDGTKNGAETDIDCGGANCGACEAGSTCRGDLDCAEDSVCNEGTCGDAVEPDPGPTCTDGIKNGAETDTDCGGADCEPCESGAACRGEADCVAGLLCSAGVCVSPLCGDGVVNPGEACDAGDANADGVADVCRTDCTVAACGDGVRDTGEACDDGNTADGDGCSADCNRIAHGFTCDGNAPDVCMATCGDGLVATGEECDDGNDIAADGCEACAVVDGYSCTTVDPSVCTAGCGDGIVAGVETCDAAGESAACDDNCTVAECGDSTLNTSAGEACDDGGDTARCDMDCTLPTCGDSYINANAGEQCDDGNSINNDGCSAACKTEYCGDGVINNTTEECDDGNTDDADGCSATCTVECDGSQTFCGVTGGCVDTDSNVLNCGACGDACGANELCMSGACASICDSVDCSALDSVCETGVCVLQSGVATCTAQASANGTTCNDSFVSCDTPTSFCQAGTCIGDALSGAAAVCPLEQPATFLSRSNTGWAGSSDTFWADGPADCGANEVLTGLTVRYGGYFMSWIGYVQGICSTVGITGDTYTMTVRGGTAALGYGASGGTVATVQCPANEAVIGFGGRAGAALDAVSVRCAPYSLTDQSGERTITQGAISESNIVGSGGGGDFDKDCASQKIARSFQFIQSPGTQGATGLQLRCDSIYLPVR